MLKVQKISTWEKGENITMPRPTQLLSMHYMLLVEA